jgi:hypothetical protein
MRESALPRADKSLHRNDPPLLANRRQDLSDYSASAMGDESRNIVPIEISQKGVRGGIGKF